MEELDCQRAGAKSVTKRPSQGAQEDPVPGCSCPTFPHAWSPIGVSGVVDQVRALIQTDGWKGLLAVTLFLVPAAIGTFVAYLVSFGLVVLCILYVGPYSAILYPAAPLVFCAPLFLGQFLAETLVAVFVARRYLQRPTPFAEAFTLVRNRFRRLVWAAAANYRYVAGAAAAGFLVVSLPIALVLGTTVGLLGSLAGVVAPLLAFVYASARWGFTPFVVMLEGHGGNDAVTRSSDVVDAAMGRLVGYRLLFWGAGLFVLIGGNLVGGLFTLLLLPVVMVLNLVLSTLSAVVMTLLYLDQRVRQGDLTQENLAREVLGEKGGACTTS